MIMAKMDRNGYPVYKKQPMMGVEMNLHGARDENGKKYLLYWSSQKSTNGYGDQLVDIDDIENIKIVRLVKPENIFSFDITKKIDKSSPGDKINLK